MRHTVSGFLFRIEFIWPLNYCVHKLMQRLGVIILLEFIFHQSTILKDLSTPDKKEIRGYTPFRKKFHQTTIVIEMEI